MLAMKCSVTCKHFSPTQGEVTLLCQNFTFMHGSDNDKLAGRKVVNLMMCTPF